MNRKRGPEVVAIVGAWILMVGACALVAEGVAPIPAAAATFAVTNTTDSATAGSNSLRDIIQNQATNAGGDEVDLVAGATYTLNVCGPGGGPLTHGNTPLTITTPSGAPATIRQTCSSGVIQQGTALITVNNVIITGGNGGGNGGGIDGGGAVTVLNSAITGNTIGVEGGGIFATGALTITNSTVSGNQSGDPGGGVFGSASVTVTNSTIAGNTAFSGAGIALGPAAQVVLVYATVVSNTAGSAGAIANIAASVGAGTTITSFGSVVALALPSGAVNCIGTTSSQGFNFSDDGTCGFTASTDKQSAGDPHLGALANNGGPTQTRLPQGGSPLIDAIPFAHCVDGNPLAGLTITTDQRGLARPSPPSGACDIGAVEVQVSTPAPAPTPVVIQPKFTG